MKIAIVSDTHDNKVNIEKAFQRINEEGIGLVIHLGDLISPFVLDWIHELYKGKLILVRGNNDGELAFTFKKIERYGYEYYQDPAIVEIKGRRFAIMHKPLLIEALRACEYLDAVLYGHTHKWEIIRGIPMILNPGTVSGYLSEPTFMILDLDTMEVELVNL